MKYKFLLFLIPAAFLLSGCSNMPNLAVGPQGGGLPLPFGESLPSPRAILPQRPMRQRRRNAAAGRSVAPEENSACKSCGGGGSCDYPVWLHEAQKRDGFYLRYAAESQANGQAREIAPFAFSRFNPSGALLTGGGEHGGRQEGRAVSAAEAPAWSSLFADLCLRRSFNPRGGKIYQGLDSAHISAANWLDYGVQSPPCFGAVMVAASGQAGKADSVAFCVGALSAASASLDGKERSGTVYLGLGTRCENGRDSNHIGLVAYAAADIAAFRLPADYRPCKEHLKLDWTPWAEQFRAKIAQKQRQRLMEEADSAAAKSADNAEAEAMPPLRREEEAFEPSAPDAQAKQAISESADRQSSEYASAAEPPADWRAGGDDEWGLNQAALERALFEDFNIPQTPKGHILPM